MTKDEARAEAQEHIAKLADADGEHTFAREVRAGAWDETNRNDIRYRMERLLSGPIA